jgi:hypothetical protein
MRLPSPLLVCALSVLAMLAVLALPRAAVAHEVGLSKGRYRDTGAAVEATLAFARLEALRLLPEADLDGSRSFDAREVEQAATLADERIVRRVRLTKGGAPCRGTVTAVRLVEEDGLELDARFECAPGRALLELRVDLLDDLRAGHRHLASLESGERRLPKMLAGDDRALALESDGAATSAAAEGPRLSLGGFVTLGVEHILIGADHLLFLLGLVLLPQRPRAVLALVTAFTLAHSLSLGLAVLSVWSPSPRVIEPLIALSVAYVGAENLVLARRAGRDAREPDDATAWAWAKRRVLLALAFGFVHGFGFAGALGEIELPRADVPRALFGFNVGVELGQLGVLLVTLPLLAFARARTRSLAPAGRAFLVANALVVLTGLVWLVTRLTG